MFNVKDKLIDLFAVFINKFLSGWVENTIKEFSTNLADIMSTSLKVLELPLVINGIKYAQILAATLIILKSVFEIIQTYILYTNGDSDADPAGVFIRTGQATAVIVCVPEIVKFVFEFGTKLANDVANLDGSKMGVNDWSGLIKITLGSVGVTTIIFALFIVISFLIVSIQATIRGAELALLTVIAPILALNLTSNNRSVWSSWFKQIIITCCSQALQIFMIKIAVGLVTTDIATGGLLFLVGWMWVTIKTPKYLQQFAYSTGFTGAVGGATKQAGSMYVMRKMINK